MVSHHLAYFAAHRSSASADVYYLICHMTSQGYLFKWSCEAPYGKLLPYHVWRSLV